METSFNSISDFKTRMASDPDLQNAFKTDPVQAANSISQTPLETDDWIYRIVVSSLGLTVIIIVVGILILIGFGHFGTDKDIPTILTAIGSAAIGALSGLLAPSPKNKS